MTEIEITKASEVKVREIEWLWYPYIPFGKITVVQGDAGDGKSTFVLNLAAMLSRGQPMPFTDGTGQPPINIIYQSSEDDADDIITYRAKWRWRVGGGYDSQRTSSATAGSVVPQTARYRHRASIRPARPLPRLPG